MAFYSPFDVKLQDGLHNLNDGLQSIIPTTQETTMTIKLITTAIFALLLTACQSYDVEPRPGYVEEITLDDGRVVLVYVPGYSIDDFKRGFYGNQAVK